MNNHYTSRINVVFKMFLILIISIIVGILLLTGVYLLPTEPMFNHVKESSKVFQIEGYYPAVDSNHNILLDNWTDSLMLNNAIYPGEDEGAFKKALLVNHIVYPDYDPVDVLLNYVNGNPLNLDSQAEAYPRYWHGYLIFLKPLLLFTTYLGVRNLNSVLVWLVMVFVIIGFIKQKKSLFVIPFLLAVLCLRPDAIVYSMQFSTSYYVMMLTSIFILFMHQRLEKKYWYHYFFFLTGIIIAYIDFLTYPLITLGVPLTIFLVLEESKGWQYNLVSVVKYSICWALGYAGMWSSKWLITSIALGGNYFSDAINTIKFRTSDHVNQYAFSRFDVIEKNFSYLTSYKFFTLLMILFLAAVLILSRKLIKKNWKNIIPFLLICCMPFVWYLVLGNHSYIHSWMTYRTLVIFVFAYLCMGVQLILDRRVKK